jgi:hypothetical protein
VYEASDNCSERIVWKSHEEKIRLVARLGANHDNAITVVKLISINEKSYINHATNDVAYLQVVIRN